MKKGTLHLVHRQANAPVMGAPHYSLNWNAASGSLHVDFEVQGRVPHVNPLLPFDQSADKLWEHDVVEVFVSLARAEDEVPFAPYLEFQVSPLGQYFELKIFKPRERVQINPMLGLVPQATKSSNSWTARFEIPLEKHLNCAKGQPIFGNLYSILGAPGSKEFWSLFTPPQTVPDFHVPSHFKRLLIVE
jgi:hypothetical protein